MRYLLHLRAWICSILATLLAVTPSVSYAQNVFIGSLPEAQARVGLSMPYNPPVLRGLIVHPDKPLDFDFLVENGHQVSPSSVKAQSDRMVRYFLAALTVPENVLWVNLSPYEKDRMIDNELGQTLLGRDMLAQDYLLKQLTASLIYPEDNLGKEFWDHIYKEAQDKFGTTDIPVNTFNKVWIMPDKAEIYEKGAAAYVTKATLKVLLDQDYVALANNKTTFEKKADATTTLTSNMIREVILPAIEKEVNEGKNFAPLRQIYSVSILAQWYRDLIKNTFLGKAYVGTRKVEGVTTSDKTLKDQIYQRYMDAYKLGVFNYIKEGTNASTGLPEVRKYFSGGLRLGNIPLDKAMDIRKLANAVPVYCVKYQARAVTAPTRKSLQMAAMVNADHAMLEDIMSLVMQPITGYVLAAILFTGVVAYWERTTIPGNLFRLRWPLEYWSHGSAIDFLRSKGERGKQAMIQFWYQNRRSRPPGYVMITMTLHHLGWVPEKEEDKLLFFSINQDWPALAINGSPAAINLLLNGNRWQDLALMDPLIVRPLLVRVWEESRALFDKKKLNRGHDFSYPYRSWAAVKALDVLGWVPDNDPDKILFYTITGKWTDLARIESTEVVQILIYYERIAELATVSPRFIPEVEAAWRKTNAYAMAAALDRMGWVPLLNEQVSFYQTTKNWQALANIGSSETMAILITNRCIDLLVGLKNAALTPLIQAWEKVNTEAPASLTAPALATWRKNNRNTAAAQALDRLGWSPEGSGDKVFFYETTQNWTALAKVESPEAIQVLLNNNRTNELTALGNGIIPALSQAWTTKKSATAATVLGRLNWIPADVKEQIAFFQDTKNWPKLAATGSLMAVPILLSNKRVDELSGMGDNVVPLLKKAWQDKRDQTAAKALLKRGIIPESENAKKIEFFVTAQAWQSLAEENSPKAVTALMANQRPDELANMGDVADDILANAWAKNKNVTAGKALVKRHQIPESEQDQIDLYVTIKDWNALVDLRSPAALTALIRCGRVEQLEAMEQSVTRPSLITAWSAHQDLTAATVLALQGWSPADEGERSTFYEHLRDKEALITMGSPVATQALIRISSVTELINLGQRIAPLLLSAWEKDPTLRAVQALHHFGWVPTVSAERKTFFANLITAVHLSPADGAMEPASAGFILAVVLTLGIVLSILSLPGKRFTSSDEDLRRRIVDRLGLNAAVKSVAMSNAEALIKAFTVNEIHKQTIEEGTRLTPNYPYMYYTEPFTTVHSDEVVHLGKETIESLGYRNSELSRNYNSSGDESVTSIVYSCSQIFKSIEFESFLKGLTPENAETRIQELISLDNAMPGGINITNINLSEKGTPNFKLNELILRQALNSQFNGFTPVFRGMTRVDSLPAIFDLQ